MPIQIRISVNENLAHTYHIGRISRNGMQADSMNEYAVVEQPNEPTNEEWDAAPRFMHRYGDDLNTIALEGINRHQQYVTEQAESIEQPSVAPLPLPSVIKVAEQNVARLMNQRKCGYQSSRMLAPCKLGYGHNGGHQS